MYVMSLYDITLSYQTCTIVIWLQNRYKDCCFELWPHIMRKTLWCHSFDMSGARHHQFGYAPIKPYKKTKEASNYTFELCTISCIWSWNQIVCDLLYILFFYINCVQVCCLGPWLVHGATRPQAGWMGDGEIWKQHRAIVIGARRWLPTEKMPKSLEKLLGFCLFRYLNHWSLYLFLQCFLQCKHIIW